MQTGNQVQPYSMLYFVVQQICYYVILCYATLATFIYRVLREEGKKHDERKFFSALDSIA